MEALHLCYLIVFAVHKCQVEFLSQESGHKDVVNEEILCCLQKKGLTMTKRLVTFAASTILVAVATFKM